MTPEQLVRKVTAITGYTHAAGVEVVTAEPGHVTLSLAKKSELLQFNGFFHGGVLSGLADHAAGAAATTALPAGKIAGTVDLHVNFFAPAKGETLFAKARTLQVGARFAWWPWSSRPNLGASALCGGPCHLAGCGHATHEMKNAPKTIFH